MEKKKNLDWIDDVVGIAVDGAVSIVLKLALKRLLLALGPGLWFNLLSWLIKKIFKWLIGPAIEDMEHEGYRVYREKELRKKLEAYKEANTNEEQDAAFDNLISGSTIGK